MQNEHDNPQSPRQDQQQQGNQQPMNRPGQDRPMTPGENPRQRDEGQGAGRKHGQAGDDEGKVGQDTDGDGKVVKPGQKPGQSGGKGLPENR